MATAALFIYREIKGSKYVCLSFAVKLFVMY